MAGLKEMGGDVVARSSASVFLHGLSIGTGSSAGSILLRRRSWATCEAKT
jgi:hypothetical protein